MPSSGDKGKVTVAWIAPMALELTPAIALLEERKYLFVDNTGYNIGRIGDHWVTMVVCPRIGTHPAATVLANAKNHFPNLRHILVVGIAGGVPSYGLDCNQIVLGDVVVSFPQGSEGGVKHYEFGAWQADGFSHSGHTLHPSDALLMAVNNLRAVHMTRQGTQMPLFLQEIRKNLSDLEVSEFSDPGYDEDHLYPDDYLHQDDQKLCEGLCDTAKRISRADRGIKAKRSQDTPRIHYGNIGSANALMMSSELRNKLHNHSQVICFEMESAGVIGSHQALVIRGVSDYSDSHKNKRWQKYAAATASAYAKELLRLVPPAEQMPLEEPSTRRKGSTYFIPRWKKQQFVGREEVLETLKKKLIREDPRSAQLVAVTGLGGVGKTQVALQMAVWVKENKPNWSVFWLPALSMAAFDQACMALAGELNIRDPKEDPKETVKRYLRSAELGRCLIIVDNADDMNMLEAVVGYLPEENVPILFTTRFRDVAFEAVGDEDGNVVVLESMSTKESQLLWDRLAPTTPAEDMPSVKEILRELAYLPLAIQQAAAFINRNPITVSKYLSLLVTTEDEMVSALSSQFNDPTPYRKTPSAVARTWTISFEQIRDTDKAAADLLSFLSLIEPRAIPHDILPKPTTEAELRRAIGTLLGYAFIQKRENNPEEYGGECLYDMHRLVHLGARIWVTEKLSLSDIRHAAVLHLAEVFPEPVWENRERWRPKMPHALKLLAVDGIYEPEEGGHDAGGLGCEVAGCLFQDGRYQEAVNLLEPAVEATNRLPEEDSDRLLWQHTLGRAYVENRQTPKAIKLLEHVVEVEGRLLSEEEPGRLASQHELARAYHDNCQHPEAMKLLEHIVAIQDRVLPQEHLNRLASQRMLGQAYLDTGQIPEAIKLLEHVVAVQVRLLPQDHPEQLVSQHELGRAYLNNGQIPEAIKLLEHVVTVESGLPKPPSNHQLSRDALAEAYGMLARKMDSS
ncbi:hypothetical protein B0I35DRAFT_348194 [Stachybotrys elegans]|uniref:NB-ARC domain-containing protein n=1 Tax=Stachybotrys elegans TaxID=80388 RepID=A0A8K0WTP8_9HYPO|nr:hypothetical protein B0I35DRAFT_348194 [Stachybotrys elegans]